MINKAILEEEVQRYIEANINTDINKLILKNSPFKTISSKELAEQIQSKKAVQKKLPTWYQTKGIIFPPKLNAEQASSEQTAAYKKQLILKGELVDLTGGFGVDDFYFAQAASKVIHCEINEQLSAIVAHNAGILQADNISFFVGDGKDYLHSISKTDTIYIDPSRRKTSGRTFLFEDCEPDVIGNLDLYLQKANRIIIKAAPMLDIDAAVNALKYVAEIHVVSLNNECKELLFVIDPAIKNQIIRCLLINNLNIVNYSFNFKEEKTIGIDFSKVKSFIYEPDAAFLKAGLFKTISREFKVDKLHANTHIYTSAQLVENFPGRTLKVLELLDFKTFSEKNKLKKANIITRNFPFKPDELKKKLKIADGGEVYLYFVTDKNEQKIVLRCERLG
jgi:precorrin-6B methylase 2